MKTDDIDKVISARKNLHFMSSMILAWDLDSIEIGEEEKCGIFFMLECIKHELELIDICPLTTDVTTTTH